MAPRHYLYPLNPQAKQKYHLRDDRGNEYPTSVEGFLDCYANVGYAEWGIYQGINDLKANDFIWVHFALPVSAIMAVGRVRDVPHFKKSWGKHAIWIDWDWKLTRKLQENPIPFRAHRQVVPISVREASPKTQKVIEGWLKKTPRQRLVQNPKPVKFKDVLVEQRQGQSDFRQSLMVAYGYKCAVTGCDVRDTLQAAHIVPVSSRGQHDVTNGLLLRADIHNLFDRGLLTIDHRYRVQLHRSIRRSPAYQNLQGKALAVTPRNPAHRPSQKNLGRHRKNHLSA